MSRYIKDIVIYKKYHNISKYSIFFITIRYVNIVKNISNVFVIPYHHYSRCRTWISVWLDAPSISWPKSERIYHFQGFV